MVFTPEVAISGIRVLLGGVVVYAGVSKMLDSEDFANSLKRFPISRLFARDSSSARALAIAVCLSEIIVGLLTIIWVWAGPVSFLLIVMLSVFTISVSWAVIRGEDVSCGCFGSSQETVSWRTVARNMCLLAASIAVFRLPAGSTTLDGLINGMGSAEPYVALQMIGLELAVGSALAYTYLRFSHTDGVDRSSSRKDVGRGLSPIWEGAPAPHVHIHNLEGP